jgi:hypothetical protein
VNPSSRAALAALLFAATAAAGQEAPTPPGRIIDRAVALVEGQVITLSDLEFEARVALVQAGGVQAATAPLDEAALRDALDLAIGQRLQASEADKLQAYSLEEAEVQHALNAFKARFGSDREYQAFLDRHEADTQLLATVLTRGLRAAKILESKLKLKAQVTEAQLKSYYEANKAELGGVPFDEVRTSLRQKLVAERLRQLVRVELEQARRTAEVRLIAPFARTDPEPSP